MERERREEEKERGGVGRQFSHSTVWKSIIGEKLVNYGERSANLN